MSIRRPDEEAIKARAREVAEECEAYPEDMRERLMGIKKAALKELVERFDENIEIIAGHYPGWEREDLKILLNELG